MKAILHGRRRLDKDKIIIPISGGTQMNRKESGEVSSKLYPFNMFLSFASERTDFKEALEEYFASIDPSEGKLQESINSPEFGDDSFYCYFPDIPSYTKFLRVGLKDFSLITADDWKLENGEPSNLPTEYLVIEAKKMLNTFQRDR